MLGSVGALLSQGVVEEGASLLSIEVGRFSQELEEEEEEEKKVLGED